MDPTPEPAMRQSVASSPLLAAYGTAVDRESAYELLQARLAATERAEQDAAARDAAEQEAARLEKEAARLEQQAARDRPAGRSSGQRTGGSVVTDFIGSRTGQSIIREIVRGVFGNRRR
jgi:hypothetical protein